MARSMFRSGRSSARSSKFRTSAQKAILSVSKPGAVKVAPSKKTPPFFRPGWGVRKLPIKGGAPRFRISPVETTSRQLFRPGLPLSKTPTFTISPVERATSSTQAILSAAAGGAVMPVVQTPSGASSQIAPSGADSASETAVEVPGPTAPKPSALPMVMAAGAGFLIGGPIGAVVGAFVGSRASKKPEAAQATPEAVAGWAALDAIDVIAFGGLWGKVKKAAKKITKPVRTTVRQFDITNRKALLGKVTPKPVRNVVRFVARPAIATSTAALTGGLSVFAAQRAGGRWKATYGVKPTAIGLAAGAAIGGAILAAPAVASAIGGGTAITGGTAASALAVGSKIIGGAASFVGGSAASAEEVVAEQGIEVSGPTAEKPSGLAALAPIAAAAAGGLLAGPIGAVAAGAAGYFLSKKKAG